VRNRLPSDHDSISLRLSQQTSVCTPQRNFFRGIFQLLRVPNLFTAIADVLAGYFIGLGGLAQLSWSIGCFLALSAVCFYAGGVVLNDVVDLPKDRLHRPNRPLPAGVISLKAAIFLGFGLLLMGWVASGLVALAASSLWPWVAGSLLGVCVLGYNFWTKSTFLGPAVMATCRVLNLGQGILAGVVLSTRWLEWAYLWTALAFGLYVAGITVFARGEAETPKRPVLLIGLVIVLLAFSLLAFLPAFVPNPQIQLPWSWAQWLLLVGLPAGILLLRFGQAWITPTPELVQRAVRQAILWIIVWDATFCFAFVGGMPALAILILLIPAGFLSLWVNPT